MINYLIVISSTAFAGQLYVKQQFINNNDNLKIKILFIFDITIAINTVFFDYSATVRLFITYTHLETHILFTYMIILVIFIFTKFLMVNIFI